MSALELHSTEETVSSDERDHRLELVGSYYDDLYQTGDVFDDATVAIAKFVAESIAADEAWYRANPLPKEAPLREDPASIRTRLAHEGDLEEDPYTMMSDVTRPEMPDADEIAAIAAEMRARIHGATDPVASTMLLSTESGDVRERLQAYPSAAEPRFETGETAVVPESPDAVGPPDWEALRVETEARAAAIETEVDERLDAIIPGEVPDWEALRRESESELRVVETAVDMRIDEMMLEEAPDWDEIRRIREENEAEESGVAPAVPVPPPVAPSAPTDEERRDMITFSGRRLFDAGDHTVALRLFLKAPAYEELTACAGRFLEARRFADATLWCVLGGDRDALTACAAKLEEELLLPELPRTYEENEALIDAFHRAKRILTLDAEAFRKEVDLLRALQV